MKESKKEKKIGRKRDGERVMARERWLESQNNEIC